MCGRRRRCTVTEDLPSKHWEERTNTIHCGANLPYSDRESRRGALLQCPVAPQGSGDAAPGSDRLAAALCVLLLYLGVHPASPIRPNRFFALCGDFPRGFGLFTAVFALSPATICLIRSPLNPMLSDTPHTLSRLFWSCSSLGISWCCARGHENQHGSLAYSCLKFTYSHTVAEVTGTR